MKVISQTAADVVSNASLRENPNGNVLMRLVFFVNSMMAKELLKLACLECKTPFRGNSNKKFCSAECKTDYHNKRRKKEGDEIGSIVNILKTNRRILLDIAGDKSVQNVSEQQLLDKGYVFRYHTHRRVNKGDNKEYIFCFDYGYLALDNGWFKVVKAFK